MGFLNEHKPLLREKVLKIYQNKTPPEKPTTSCFSKSQPRSCCQVLMTNLSDNQCRWAFPSPATHPCLQEPAARVRSEPCLHHWPDLGKAACCASGFYKGCMSQPCCMSSGSGANPKRTAPEPHRPWQGKQICQSHEMATYPWVMMCSTFEPSGNGFGLRMTILDYYSY